MGENNLMSRIKHLTDIVNLVSALNKCQNVTKDQNHKEYSYACKDIIIFLCRNHCSVVTEEKKFMEQPY